MASPNVFAGSGFQTKHHAVAKAKKIRDSANGRMNEEIRPEQFCMVPKLYEAICKGDTTYFNALSVANQTPSAQHEEAINIPPNMSRTSCLSQVTYSGDTILHIAARFGQLEVARWICEEGGSDLLMSSNTKEETPLHYAAQAGNLGLVQLFIKHALKKDTDIRNGILRKSNENGETALYQAVRHKHKEVVDELMRTDIKLASILDNQNVSPLYLATMLNSLPIVTSLVGFLSGNNVENIPREAYSGPDERTALHAAAHRDKDFVQQILRLKANEIKSTADKVGDTPLHYAASVNNVGAVKLLLEADETSLTSAYVTNKCGSFPVHIAAKLGHVEVLIELFEHCPDCDELLDGLGRNFIHLAVEEKKEAVVQWVCQNVKFEKAINAQDKEGNTPLHLAVKAKDKGTFRPLILSRRAQFSCVNNDGLTPLDIADAQRKDVFSHWKNPEYVIYQILGTERMDHVRQENNC